MVAPGDRWRDCRRPGHAGQYHREDHVRPLAQIPAHLREPVRQQGVWLPRNRVTAKGQPQPSRDCQWPTRRGSTGATDRLGRPHSAASDFGTFRE